MWKPATVSETVRWGSTHPAPCHHRQTLALEGAGCCASEQRSQTHYHNSVVPLIKWKATNPPYSPGGWEEDTCGGGVECIVTERHLSSQKDSSASQIVSVLTSPPSACPAQLLFKLGLMEKQNSSTQSFRRVVALLVITTLWCLLPNALHITANELMTVLKMS